MADESVLIKLGLSGQGEVSRGFRDLAADEQRVGDQATATGIKTREMGASFTRAGGEATATGMKVRQMGAEVAKSVDGVHFSMGRFGYQLPYVALGITGLAAAGVKWGLSFNAQVETARIRFQNFTGGSAKGAQLLVDQVQKINAASRFNLSNLTNAAAELGNMGVAAGDIPNVLRGIANAAAASGGGNDALDRMALAIGQIQSKGRLSQEELNQLTEAGAPYVNQTIAKGFNLTAKQVQNIGNNALDSKKAIGLLTREWTSGALAGATKRDLNSLAGQWSLFTDNAQEASGAMTKGLAAGLEHNLLPVANRALTAITQIFGDKGLSDHEKLMKARDVIVTDLGPTWDLIKRDIDKANIPQHFGAAVGAALPKLADAAAQAAPGAAKAFVDGWLNSGPWVQFLSAAYLAKKLGAFGALGKALGKGGPAGGVFGGGVGTLKNPAYVVVLDKMPGAGKPGVPGAPAERGAKSFLKRAVKFGATGAALEGGAEGVAAFGAPEVAGAVAGLIAASAAGYGVGRGIGNLLNSMVFGKDQAAATHGLLPMPQAPVAGNFATRTIQAPNPQFATSPFPKYIGNTIVMPNGQVLLQVTTTAQAQQKARTK